MILVTHGFIFSVHILKEPQIVIGFVLLVLSRHAVIVLVLSRHAINILVSRYAIITILKLVCFTFFFFITVLQDARIQ